MTTVRAAVAVLCLLASMALAAPAHANKRVALVVGNDRYPNLPADRAAQEGGQRRARGRRRAAPARLRGDPRREPRPPGAGRQARRADAQAFARRHRILLLCRPWGGDQRRQLHPAVRRAEHRKRAGDPARARRRWARAISSPTCRRAAFASPSWCSTPAATIRSSGPACAAWAASAASCAAIRCAACSRSTRRASARPRSTG